jgi:hypothetical protein
VDFQLRCSEQPITELCGVRTENYPPGVKTGDQISPPGGYVGGGLQVQTDLAIGPADDVWVMNNWEGVVVFFGMAMPVRAPQIGPAQPY